MQRRNVMTSGIIGRLEIGLIVRTNFVFVDQSTRTFAGFADCAVEIGAVACWDIDGIPCALPVVSE